MTVGEIAKIKATQQGRENDLVYQELLKNQIISLNSVLIKQSYEKTGFLNQTWIQTVKCIPLKLVCDSDLPEQTLRTIDKVPKPLQLKRDPFIAVYNNIVSKNRVQLSYLTPEQLPGIIYRRFTSQSLYYTWENDYIYIIGSKLLEKISVRAIFDNPFTLSQFAKTQCADCEDNEESNCFDNDDLVITEYISGVILSSFMNEKSD